MSERGPGNPNMVPGNRLGISGRWKPGQSGNPKGRPLSKPFKASLERVLSALHPEHPESALDELNAAIYSKALNGDVAAYKELADRYEGKVPNPIGGTDELPPITAFSWKPVDVIEHLNSDNASNNSDLDSGLSDNSSNPIAKVAK